ncbi:MAG: hypothetical protein GX786_00495 [Clostridiales bacterium]|nr:hypothetical protein [Clostridiales bacterium]
MKKNIVCFFIALMVFLPFFSFLSPNAALASSNPVSCRSLFVAGDLYVTEENTWPSFVNSAKLLASSFEKGTLPFLSPPSSRIYSSSIKSVSGLRKAIRSTFFPADENDVSYFYISVHGIQPSGENNSGVYLLLSDGTKEEKLTPTMLEEAFEGIKGTKVIIIDACHSGAFIGKGVSGGAVTAAFTDPSFKVLVSAGGSEKSWMYTPVQNASDFGTLNYFSSALAQGLGIFGKPEADINRNGEITLKEVHKYLLNSYALSTPYVYPENDDFVLFTYNPHEMISPQYHSSHPIVDVEMASTIISSTSPTVSFSYTALVDTKVAYQLFYYKDNAWQLDYPDIKEDIEKDGFIYAGRKSRTLHFTPPERSSSFDYGYAMLQVVAFVDGLPVVQASRLLTVIPDAADPNIHVYTNSSFIPEKHFELPIFVRHSYPCKLSVAILDEKGATVMPLVNKEATRPSNALPKGSFFYWDGIDLQGNFLPQGSYRIQVKAFLGKNTFQYTSSPILVIRESEG